MRIAHFIYGLIIFLTSAICLADNGSEDGGSDKRMFIKGSSVTVLLNYDQFISTQMVANHPTLTRKNLESAVQIAIDRWVQVTGLNLKINYGGLTTKTSSGAGEILIGAAVDPDAPGRFASATPDETNDVTNGNCSLRFFRRSDGIENDWYVFNFKDYPSGGIFISATLMHEFGHCLGLHHNENSDGPDQIATLRTVMLPSVTLHAFYGPFIEDVEDIIALYGSRPSVQFDVLQSTNDGLAWNSINSDIPKVATSQTPVVNRDDDRMTLFFTNLAHHPASITATNQGQSWTKTPFTFFSNRSLYGTTGSGSGNEYMWAWVDPDDKNYVTIVYTGDAGAHWEDRSAGFRAASAPSIRKIDNSTWIISYLYLDENTFKNENGRVMSRVSFNDGLSWGPAIELGPGLRGSGGVTVTSQGRNDIRIGFVRTSNADDRWTSTITSIAAHINSNNSLVRDNWTSRISESTISEASFTATSRVFVLGFKTLDQRLSSCNRDFDNEFWQVCTMVNAFSFRGIPPAVAGKANSNFVYMIKEK